MKAHIAAGQPETPPTPKPLEPSLFSKVTPRGALSAAAIGLAALIAALILTPVGVWHQPATDAVYKGFDPNLMYISPSGPAPNAGVVTMSQDTLTIEAKGNSHPTVHLLTTPLSFSAAFDAEVVSAPADTMPLRIELWSPESSAGYVVVFDSANGNVIRADTITGGESLQDLFGGTVMNTGLGTFEAGQTYHVAINVDQANRKIDVHLAGPGVITTDSTITPTESPELFKAFRYTLTASAFAQSDSSTAVIRNFAITLPHQTSSTAEETVKVDDDRARFLSQILWAAAILMCALAAVLWAWPRLARRSRVSLSAFVYKSKVRLPLLVGLVLALAIYLLANMALFGVASPHYDVLSAKVWAYDAYKNGIADLYYRTVLVPAAGAWLGVPQHEAGFPYGVTKVYYYVTAGWLYHFWPSPSGALTINTFSLEGLLKSINVLFGFADGILVYLILKRFVGPSSALTSAILLALNPAVALVMSVWGSTETISIFFVLSSILLAERGQPLGAWLMLAGAAFTRPQMFVLAFLLGAVYLRKFGVAPNLRAIAWTVIVAFVFIGPLAIAISPSMPVDWLARTLIFHFGNGQADLPYLGTSPGYYSVWTLPLLLVSGQHGLDRMWSPETQHLIGSLTYGQVGAALSVLLLLAVGSVLLFGKTVSLRPGQYFPLIAFGMLGWLMVTPGLISRYFVYAIVAIILCRKAFSTAGYLWTLAILTAITCISAYGHLALDFLGYSGSVGLMSPTNNGFSLLVFDLFSSDWFINLAALTNIAILAVIGYKAWLSLRERPRPAVRAAATLA